MSCRQPQSPMPQIARTQPNSDAIGTLKKELPAERNAKAPAEF